MFKSQRRFYSCLALGVAALGAYPLSASAQTPPAGETAGPQSNNSDRSDVVIVTATRRETALEDTPQAISALSGDNQFDRGQTRLEDLSASVPNVNFAATSNTSQFYVRGIGNTFLNAGGDPGVAFYQDNAYVSDQTTTNVSLFDINRIEVLRGPQGALYGRNAVGGAIHVISAEPTSTPEGRIAITVGDYGLVEAEGFASGALGLLDTDARLSFQSKHHDGYIKNELAGQPGAPDTFNDLDSQAVRGQTLTHFAGGGELRLLAGYYDQADVGDALAVTPTPGIAYAVETLYGELPSNNPDRVRANLGVNEVRVYTGNAEYRQPLGDNDLTVTAAYRESKQHFENDCDGTIVDNCRYIRRNSAKDYYLDGHLASPGDAPFSWLVGAVYQRFLIDQLNDVTFPFPASYLDPVASPTTPVDMRVFAGGSVTVESYAAYLDLRYALNDVWAITGQVRRAATTKDALERLRIDTFGVNVVDLPNSIDETSTPYKVGVEAHFNDLLLYANYATAYKDGAINLGAVQPSPVSPETAKSYEAGAKATFFEGGLQLNGSAFHSDYEDLQLSRVVGTVVALVNVPKATIDGIELELAAHPADGLTATLTYGYLDGTLDQFSNSRVIPGLSSGPLEDLSGNSLPYVAKHTLNAGLEYVFSPFTGFEAQLAANYAYRSRIFFNEFNDAYNSQPSVGTLDISGSLSPDAGNWKAFFYVRNVTDETVRTGSTIYSGLIGAARAVSYAPPRHFGVGLSLSY